MNQFVGYCSIITFCCISALIFPVVTQTRLLLSYIFPNFMVLIMFLFACWLRLSQVREVGYVWSENPAPDLQSGVVVTKGTGSFVFSDTVTGLKTNTTYYFRAYATGEDNVTLYSPERSSVTSVHSISSFSPLVVSTGMDLIIHGDFAPGNSKVYFDDLEVPIKNGSTSSALIVEVPFGLTNHQIKVSVEMSGHRLTFANIMEYRKGRWLELEDMDEIEEDNRFPFAAVHNKKAYVLGSNGVLYTYHPTSGIWEKRSEHPYHLT